MISFKTKLYRPNYAFRGYATGKILTDIGRSGESTIMLMLIDEFRKKRGGYIRTTRTI